MSPAFDDSPGQNPYAAPQTGPPEFPNPIPEIAAPQDAVDGPDAIRFSGEVTPAIAERARTVHARVSLTPGKIAAAILGALFYLGFVSLLLWGLLFAEPEPRNQLRAPQPEVEDERAKARMTAFMILLAGPLIAARVFYAWRAGSVFRQGRFTGCASTRGIELTYPGTDETIRLGWKFVTGAVGDGGVMLLYAYPQSCLLIPDHAFAGPADHARFVDWLRMFKIRPVGKGF
jgi:hypothetical protein